MFDERFRRRFQPLAAPVVARMARSGVTPNAVTAATFVVALAAAAVVASGYAVAGVLLWLGSRIGDGLDGALARVTGQQSAFGGYFDITADMAAYSVMVLAFAWIHPAHAMAWGFVLAGYVVVITTTLALSDAAHAAGRRASATDRTFQFTPGLTEAGETNVIYAVWALFPAQLDWTIWLWVVALWLTAAQRTSLAWRLLK